MTASLQAYPEYKDSALPWLGQVPKHWDIEPAFACFAPRLVRNKGMQETTVLSLSYGRIVVKPPDKLHGLVPESFETYQIVEPGDIIIRTTDLQNDHKSLRVGLVEERGIITSAYLCLRSKNSVSSVFAYQYLNTWDLTKAIYGYGSGLRQNLDFSHFKRMQVALPSPKEQMAIDRYLTATDRRIDRLIRNRQRLIELLNEQKQAIINRAVTRGLNPDIPLKPSGIDWLGDVPEHWEVLKIKRIARINPSRAEAFHMRESSKKVVFLPMERVSTEGGIDDFERRPIKEVWQGFTYFRRGDVVLAKITPCFENGKGADLSTLDTDVGFGTTEFIVLRPSQRISAEFLYQLTQLTYFRSLGVESMTGAAGQQRVPPNFVMDFGVPIPPPEEQSQIVSYANSVTTQLLCVVDRARREIDLIREYRTRLIADVVTGKLDVREAAVDLPEELEKERDTEGATEETEE
ncbi:MAG: restriction endonuclease subunit S [candidate division Zixibacteria bacterium]|nr:restriction endonuclease subunit S [candidate division Zixibacteria bacterium]